MTGASPAGLRCGSCSSSLLLVLRAPVAALALTVLGAGTVGSGFGALTLVGKAVDVDAVALTGASLVGLALGVAFSLMLYVRWRDELRPSPPAIRPR